MQKTRSIASNLQVFHISLSMVYPSLPLDKYAFVTTLYI